MTLPQTPFGQPVIGPTWSKSAAEWVTHFTRKRDAAIAAGKPADFILYLERMVADFQAIAAEESSDAKD